MFKKFHLLLVMFSLRTTWSTLDEFQCSLQHGLKTMDQWGRYWTECGKIIQHSKSFLIPHCFSTWGISLILGNLRLIALPWILRFQNRPFLGRKNAWHKSLWLLSFLLMFLNTLLWKQLHMLLFQSGQSWPFIMKSPLAHLNSVYF